MDFPFPFQPKDKGQVLYDSLFEYLNLDERDYFGLNYYDKSDNLVSTLHAVFVCLWALRSWGKDFLWSLSTVSTHVRVGGAGSVLGEELHAWSVLPFCSFS